MLDVTLFCDTVPVGMELMYFTGSFSHFFNIKGFVDLTETTLTQEAEQLVFFNPDPVRDSGVRIDFSVLGVLFLEE